MGEVHQGHHRVPATAQAVPGSVATVRRLFDEKRLEQLGPLETRTRQTGRAAPDQHPRGVDRVEAPRAEAAFELAAAPLEDFVGLLV